MAQSTYKTTMKFLKMKLKRSGVSYSRLSTTLDVPESTLKKWFSADDGSFNRISKICETLGLPVYLVLKEAEEQNIKTFSFSKDQQVAFLKDYTAFKAYWLMVYERKSQDEAMILLNLKATEFRKILFKLDRMGLIQLGSGDLVKVPKMRPVEWKFSGAFMNELSEEWVSGILKDSKAEKNASRLILQFFQLTTNSQQEFLNEIRMLEEKYARRTIMELSGDKQNLKQIRYLSGCAEGSFIL
jgi:hypothetical protein